MATIPAPRKPRSPRNTAVLPPDAAAPTSTATQEHPPEVRTARWDRSLINSGGNTNPRYDPLYADEHLQGLLHTAAEDARRAARAQGYAAGWAEGRRAAAEQARLEHQARAAAAETARLDWTRQAASTLTALAQATRSAHRAGEATWAAIADELLDGAFALARAVLARELATVDDVTAESIRCALRVLADPEALVVHIHPDDLAALAQLPADALPAGLRLLPDPGVPPGGARVGDGARQLLVHLPSALDTAREVLEP